MPGESIPVENLADLKVFFLKGKAIHPENPDDPSVYYEYEEKWEVTQHKVAEQDLSKPKPERD